MGAAGSRADAIEVFGEEYDIADVKYTVTVYVARLAVSGRLTA